MNKSNQDALVPGKEAEAYNNDAAFEAWNKQSDEFKDVYGFDTYRVGYYDGLAASPGQIPTEGKDPLVEFIKDRFYTKGQCGEDGEPLTVEEIMNDFIAGAKSEGRDLQAAAEKLYPNAVRNDQNALASIQQASFIAGAKWAEQNTESDAEEFGEWIFENGWCWAKDIPECYGWYNDSEVGKDPPKTFTTQQLYILFITHKEKGE